MTASTPLTVATVQPSFPIASQDDARKRLEIPNGSFGCVIARLVGSRRARTIDEDPLQLSSKHPEERGDAMHGNYKVRDDRSVESVVTNSASTRTYPNRCRSIATTPLLRGSASSSSKSFNFILTRGMSFPIQSDVPYISYAGVNSVHDPCRFMTRDYVATLDHQGRSLQTSERV